MHLTKENYMNEKCVLIFGMHRSGTSVLSHAIEILGANLGPDLLKAGTDNQKVKSLFNVQH